MAPKAFLSREALTKTIADALDEANVSVPDLQNILCEKIVQAAELNTKRRRSGRSGWAAWKQKKAMLKSDSIGNQKSHKASRSKTQKEHEKHWSQDGQAHMFMKILRTCANYAGAHQGSSSVPLCILWFLCALVLGDAGARCTQWHAWPRDARSQFLGPQKKVNIMKIVERLAHDEHISNISTHLHDWMYIVATKNMFFQCYVSHTGFTRTYRNIMAQIASK